jgi:hypothetical protein
MVPVLWFGLGALTMSLVTENKERKALLGHQQLTDATGVAVGVNCEAFETVNTERAQLTFMGGYIDARMRGLADPAAIATLIVRRYSPRCLAGENVNSLAELEFYDSIYVDVLAEMLDGDVLDSTQYTEYEVAHDEWFQERTLELEQQ